MANVTGKNKQVYRANIDSQFETDNNLAIFVLRKYQSGMVTQYESMKSTENLGCADYRNAKLSIYNKIQEIERAIKTINKHLY
jgi:hypothetical protein